MGFVGAVFCSAYRTRIINFRTHNRLNNELTILLLLGRLVARTLNAAVCTRRLWLETLFCRAVHASHFADNCDFKTLSVTSGFLGHAHA